MDPTLRSPPRNLSILIPIDTYNFNAAHLKFIDARVKMENAHLIGAPYADGFRYLPDGFCGGCYYGVLKSRAFL